MKQVLIAALIFCSSISFAQEKKSISTIQVRGEAKQKVMPNEGTVYLTASFIGLDVNQSMIGLDKKTKEITKQLVEAGLKEKDVRTNNFQLNVNRVYRKGATKDSGYVTSQSVEVKFNYSKEAVAKILNSMSKSKSDYNLSFAFSVSDSLQNATKKVLMTNSVNDARNKAQILTTAASAKLKSIKEIQYTGASNMPIYPYERAAFKTARMDEGGDAMQGFTPNEIEITDEVIVIWELE